MVKVIFDNITGNPPYQKNNENTKDDPLFQYFYDFAKTYGTRYCLISPAKFLFNHMVIGSNSERDIVSRN